MRFLLSAFAVASVGCATTTAMVVPVEVSLGEWVSWPLTPPPPPPFPEPEPARMAMSLPQMERTRPQNRMVRKALELVGLSTLKLAVPHLPDDCTGLVRAVYEDSGIELMSAVERGDNGVTAMFRLAFERRALHNRRPAPGDLVFFRETYDRNRDGQHNDGLTHVGVVESVDASSTVTFVHRINGGVKRGKLSMRAPMDRKRNDYLRPAKKGEPALLTGELFVTFASAVRLAAAPEVQQRIQSARR